MTIPTLKIDQRLQPPTANGREGEDLSSTGTTNAVDANFIPADELDSLQAEVDAAQADLEKNDFLNRSIQAFEASDTFFNERIRPILNDSLKSYNNQHTSSSPYADTESGTVFRPKIRTAVKKYVAAAKASFFSNRDAVSIEAENPSDKAEVISAAIMKSLINYRTSKTLKWPQIVLGGFKAALTDGLVCAHVYWDMKMKSSGSMVEKPCVDLVSLENLRFDESADWTDIVNSTPYLIILEEMYIGDVKDVLDKPFFRGCQTIPLADTEIAAAVNKDNATTKQQRTNNKDGGDRTSKPNDYQKVIVQMHIHRIAGEDWIWYTLNNTVMMTEPRPLEEVYFHGKRPFIIGSADIEPFSAYVTSFCTSLLPIQEETNILANQRRTNVDMAMNAKWRVDPDAGDQFDPNALLSNEVGSIVLAAKDEIDPLRAPDVTQSSYQEQAVLDKDFADAAGDYGPQANLGQKQAGDAYKTHQMFASGANQVVEYSVSMYSMTFVEPLIRMLVLVEQYYETDEVIVGLAGQQAGLFQKFNGKVQWSKDANRISGAPDPSDLPQVTQPQTAPQGPQGVPSASAQMGAEPGGMPSAAPPPQPQMEQHLPPGMDVTTLLSKELTIMVNVGLNATDPMLKQERLLSTIGQLMKLGVPAMALDIKEIAKELFATAGYGDGTRFLNQNVDPDKARLMQIIQQLTMKEKMNLPKIQSSEKVAAAKIQSNERIEAAKLDLDSKELKAHLFETMLDHSRAMEEMHIDPAAVVEAANTPNPQGA